MLDIFVNLLKSIFVMLKYPIFVVVSIMALFCFMCLVFIIIGFTKGKRFKKGQHTRVKQHGFFRKLVIDAPKQYVEDMFNMDPDFFKHQGLIIYEGRQGSGKTSTMIHDAMIMQKEYPLCKCITNLGYKNQNDELKHWRKLVNYKNGKYGVIAIMDELQNWFSSNQSKNFPPEMLQTITQNRKNRRVILGTAQSFYLLAKAIRSQCTEVRSCITFLGCITVVRRRIPILDSDGNVSEWKNRGMYFYVHNKELRESYDTYKVIESLVKSGFQDIQPETNVVNYVSVEK
jgi:hypothetical protein